MSIWQARETVGRLRWGTLASLLVPAVFLLVLTVLLSVLVTRSTIALSSNVQITQAAVDGNVRTLGQAQRELLRLEISLAADRPTTADLELHRSLTAQRVEEGTLSYQGRVLGDGSLLSRSRSLAGTWQGTVEPAVRRVMATPRPTAAARQQVIMQIAQLEQGYNTLVADAEIRRKIEAEDANQATAQIVSGTRWLLLGLLTTLLSFVVLVAGMVRVLQRAGAERRRATADLDLARSTLQRQSVALQTIDNLVTIMAADGRAEWVNEAFIRHTGWETADIVGTVPGQLLHGPDTDPRTIELVRDRLAAREGFSCEILNYTKGGASYWVQLEVRPIRNDAGRVDGFVAVQSDITTRRAAADALRDAKEVAEETARAKASFLATMSHEIRTPLNAVLGLTELLLGTPLEAEQRTYAATANHSGRLLLSLLNDILDFSALDAGKVELAPTPLEVVSILEDVEQMLRPSATQRGLTLSHTVAPGVPALVRTDGNRLRQVLINLVGNGLRFTPSGEVSLEVSFRPDREGERSGFLTLAVRDTGIGIPADRLQRIFEPFSQGDASTSRTYGGTGLGLAICTHVAAQMGGELGVTSEPGVGSTFTFSVPVGECAVTPAVPVDPVTTPHGLDAELRVLLAEDDPVNRLVAMAMLRQLGIDPDVAVDGREAFELTLAGAYDVVLMDVHMPGTDGLEATRLIHEHLSAPPRIVALTANALDGDRERFLAAGMDGYISKPFTLDDLASALGRTVADAAAARRDPVRTTAAS
ncbi:ATP-binding protein [Dermatophilaceae bacterium Soc4.6]